MNRESTAAAEKLSDEALSRQLGRCQRVEAISILLCIVSVIACVLVLWVWQKKLLACALLAVGAAGYALGRKKYPDRVIEVETAPKSGNAEVDALIREARGQLDQIAAANDAIADPALSRQIEDIEATCRLILQRLEEQPNMLSQLRTFLRYYLPATLKLLNARAALEAEVSAGQSADIAARIAKAVEQVQSAFHKQLDALNEFRFINLESEMDVLADMLKSDGLTAEPDAPAAKEAEAPQEDDPFASLFAKGEKK